MFTSLVFSSFLFLIQPSNARVFDFIYQPRKFPPNTTLSDLLVDDVAVGKAEKISVAIQEIFGPTLVRFDSMNLSSACIKDLEFTKNTWNLLKNCNHEKTCMEQNRWVRTVVDSQGRRPSGVEFGNRYWLGGYHQCKSVQIRSNKIGSTAKFLGRYCRMTIPANTLEDVLFGICAPDTCSAGDLHNLVANFDAISGYSISCREKPDISKDPSAIVAVAVFCGLFVILAIATVLDFIYLRTYRQKTRNERKNLQTVLSKGTHQPTEISGTMFQQAILSFSVLSNGAKLFSLKRLPDQIPCLHGIRVLTCMLVIVYHTVYIFWMSDNMAMIFTTSVVDKSSMSIPWTATDTFFVLGGLTLSLSWLKDMKIEKQRSNIKRPLYWLRFYLKRYIRLTPVYAMILWYYNEIYVYTGDGPMWPTKADHQCNGQWWPFLLYVNNFVESRCMIWTWYLAADFQCYLCAPIILVLLLFYPKVARALVAVLVIICATATGYVVAVNEYAPNLAAGFLNYGGISRWAESFSKVFIKPYFRYNPYIIGLVLGHLISSSKGPRRKMNKIAKILCWSATTIYFYAHIYVPFSVSYLPPIANGIYSGLARTLWSLFVAWVIYQCFTGSARLANWILSWKYWLPLSRLSYCIYIVQAFVYDYLIDSADVPYHFESFLTPVYLIIICTALSLLLAIIATLAFEMPAAELYRLFTVTRRNEQNGAATRV